MGYKKGLGMKLSPEGRKIYKAIERKAKKQGGRGQGGHGLFSGLVGALKGVVNVASNIATASNNFLKKFGFSNQDLITLIAYASGQSQFSPWIAGLRLAASKLTRTDNDVEGLLRKAKENGATDSDIREMREALSGIAEQIIRDRGGKDPPAGSLLSSLRSAKKKYVDNWISQRQERRDDSIYDKLDKFDAEVERAKRRCKNGIRRDCDFLEDAPARRRRIQAGEGKRGRGKKSKIVKKFLRKNAVAIVGSSAAILAGLVAYNKNNNADKAYDVKKKGSKSGFPVVINGVTINTQEGLDAMSKVADKKKKRDKDEFGNRFFKKTSNGKLRGDGMDNSKSVKTLCKAYPKLHPDCAKLVLRKIENMGGAGQLGKGVLSKIVNKSVDLYNKIMGHKKDPRDHVLAGDETHAVFKNKKGALVRAQFAGPNTEIVKNIRRLDNKHKGVAKDIVHMDNFVSETDKIAMLHDLRYYIDGSDVKKVRHADLMMDKKLDESRKKGNSRFNVWPSKIGIRGKMILEDIGVLKKGSFAKGNAANEVSPEDMKLLMKVKKQLEQEGYGKPKERPPRKKPSKWVQFIKDYATKHNISYRDALKAGAPAYQKMKNKN